MWCVAPLSTIHIFLEVATPQRIWVRNVPALAKVTGEEKFSLKFEEIGLFCRRASKHCHLKQRPQLRKPFCFWPLFLLHVCWSPMKFPTFITCMSTFATMITTLFDFCPFWFPCGPRIARAEESLIVQETKEDWWSTLWLSSHLIVLKASWRDGRGLRLQVLPRMSSKESLQPNKKS